MRRANRHHHFPHAPRGAAHGRRRRAADDLPAPLAELADLVAGDRLFRVGEVYVRLRPESDPLLFGECPALERVTVADGWAPDCLET